MKKLTKKEQARKSLLIHELARMSRNGWQGYHCCDWQPLEQELTALHEKEGR